MQFVDLARAARMLEAPHPLLGDDMDFQGVFRRRQRGELVRGRPPEQEQEAEQRRDRPADLDLVALALRHFAARHGRAAVIQSEEDDDQPADKEHDQAGDDRHQIEQVIDLDGIVGGFGGELVEMFMTPPSAAGGMTMREDAGGHDDERRAGGITEHGGDALGVDALGGIVAIAEQMDADRRNCRRRRGRRRQGQAADRRRRARSAT